MSHVGRRFGLCLDDRALRIVVIGQESGWPKGRGAAEFERRVSLQMPYRAIHDRSGLERRYHAQGQVPGRNPHMRGTTSALRVILGKGLGSDQDGEFVPPTNGRAFHIFDGFALVNRLLCSAGPRGSNEGHPTRTMFRNCEEHLRATLSILEPTIVIIQGGKVARQTMGIFRDSRSLTDELHETRFDGQRVLVCTFSHPAARGSLRWGASLDAPYLKEIVEPTLRSAVRAP